MFDINLRFFGNANHIESVADRSRFAQTNRMYSTSANIEIRSRSITKMRVAPLHRLHGSATSTYSSETETVVEVVIEARFFCPERNR
jgi:hypothetical protein